MSVNRISLSIEMHFGCLIYEIVANRKKGGWHVSANEEEMLCERSTLIDTRHLAIEEVISEMKAFARDYFGDKDLHEVNYNESDGSPRFLVDEQPKSLEELDQLLDNVLQRLAPQPKPAQRLLTSAQKKERSRLGWSISDLLS
jgi:hypothetical protein